MKNFKFQIFSGFLVSLILLNGTSSIGQSIQVSLNPSLYNGYNISCFGSRDGSITLTVSGGTPPYTYTWSNGSTTKDVSDLASGYYRVHVKGTSGPGVDAEITLEEPEAINVDQLISTYPSGYNISCYNCYNGSILLYPTGGVLPYTFTWEDGPTTQDRFNLGTGNYFVTLTDANQCVYSPEAFYLNEPERSDWTMSGNLGSNPLSNFIGTKDAKDLVFKTNNLERFRVLSTGEIKLNAFSGLGNKLLMTNNDGKIIATPCFAWMECGNILASNHFLGSTNPIDLVFKANNSEIMRLEIDGDVGIGTSTPYSKLEIRHSTVTGVAGGLTITNEDPGNKNSEIKFNHFFNNQSNLLWAIGTDLTHNEQDNFFIYDQDVDGLGNGATRFLIDADGKIGIGTESPSEKLHVDGSILINGEDRGLIVDEGANRRVGFMKYLGREGGIWRAPNIKFEIGRVTNTLQTPNGWTTDLVIDGEGKVGIGVLPSANSMYRLFVANGIVTNDVLVTIDPFPDFVFDDDYKRISIESLELFIEKNKHLPWFPSAEEVKNSEGVSVASLQKSMIQSIEEMALLIIDLKKEIELLKSSK
ncbi:MAG: SprB repeat-containing protein [Bacteroidetes bacterium]|nr:SprB repeat-containing protein [Bacteroidota bacterium]